MGHLDRRQFARLSPSIAKRLDRLALVARFSWDVLPVIPPHVMLPLAFSMAYYLTTVLFEPSIVLPFVRRN